MFPTVSIFAAFCLIGIPKHHLAHEGSIIGD
jgi:hypothetical protein